MAEVFDDGDAHEHAYVPTSMRATAVGASHGSELGFVFESPPEATLTYGDKPTPSPEDESVAKATHAYWVAFAKTAQPGITDGTAWTQFRAGDERVLEFGDSGTTLRTAVLGQQLDIVEKLSSASGKFILILQRLFGWL